MKSYRLLIVEDDAELREGIRILLKGGQFEINEAGSGEEALRIFNNEIDLVILDIMLPAMSGVHVCEEIRKTSNVPILFLTAKASDSDKMLGFMAGGDDYLVNPFSYTELLVRVKAQLRRYYQYKGAQAGESDQSDGYFRAGKLVVNRQFNNVAMDGVTVSLSDLEYRILLLLMEYPEQIFSARNIYESVWQEPYYYVSNNTVMVHIRNLRKKIEYDPQRPEMIRTVWGKGYKFHAENEDKTDDQ